MKASFVLVALAPLLLPLAAMAGEDGSLVEVFATGMGTTQDEAMKAANKAAIEQVVGMMIDPMTLVENDELVEDRILTYSSGLIADSKIVAGPMKSADDFISVKVRATVKKTALRDQLAAAKRVSSKIDGESLWAQMVSAQDNFADAEAMISDVLARRSACIVAETVAGKTGKSPLDFDPKTGEVFANVRVRIDPAKYGLFVKELSGKLGSMAERKTSYRGKMDVFRGEDRARKDYYFKPPSFRDRLVETKNVLVIVENMQTLQATAMVFGDDKFSAIEKECGLPTALKVSLLDGNGKELAARSRPLPEGEQNLSVLARTDTVEGSPCACVPFCGGRFDYDGQMIDSSDWHPWTERTLRISLGVFAPDALRSASQLDVKTGRMENGQFVE